jgi:DNA primase (bacterial type)
MTFIATHDKERIVNAAEGRLLDVIRDFIPDIDKKGKDWVCKCPGCGREDGLTISEAKQIFKCHKCNDVKGNSSIAFLMGTQKYDYKESLLYLKDKFNIIIDEPAPKKQIKPVKTRKKEDSGKFCTRMLAESGLTYEDVTANILKSDGRSTITESPTFKPGTTGRTGEVDSNGDDAIIYYYDLEGFPVVYEVKNGKGALTGKFKAYYRVRWQFPDEHKDQHGKPYKYKSPSGSDTYIYIPNRIRKAYKAKEKIARLYIQEGEKKAEKACKHGILSIAISGIQNLGTKGRLPEDLIKIIMECQVDEVCFLLDSDWDDISANIKIDDNVERRPRTFFYAVKNYRDYMRTLKNRNKYVEIFFGYVKKNDAGDKGIDDLLSNSLKDKEDLLLKDIEFAINEKDKAGEYVQLHQITSISDSKIEEYWHLNNPKAFAKHHKEILKNLPEFKIGKHKWRFDGEDIVSAQPIDSDEQFWEEKYKKDKDGGNAFCGYDFKYGRAFRFLENRGFGRYLVPGAQDSTFKFIHVTPPTVRSVQTYEIRDYITEFAKVSATEDILEMIYRGGTQYLGPDKLQNLSFIYPDFEERTRDRQYFYFKEKCWEVTANYINEIEYSSINHLFWHDMKKDFPAKRFTEPMIKAKRDASGHFSYTLSKEGKACHFLQFLINASNFTWRNEQLIDEDLKAGRTPKIKITPEEYQENNDHLFSKLCSIGYMMLSHKDRSVSRAVIAMDGKQSEVGTSHGRSGKSLVGLMFQKTLPTVYIPGKNKDLVSDQFLWNDIEPETKIVFIDDTMINFDLEFFFPHITGDWSVNKKGGVRLTIPFEQSPKIYIPTNHAIVGDGGSYTDRQWIISFSDFYSDTHKPVDDFGVQFFTEWDYEQWNLMWNLLAECVQLYLKFGVVQAPAARIEQRKLRQQIGEEFLIWAEEYFSDKNHLNVEIARKVMFDAFIEFAPDQRKFCKAQHFKKKIINYCEWKGYIYNPHRLDKLTGKCAFLNKDGQPDMDHKSNGVEYFTIGEPDHWDIAKPDASPEQNSGGFKFKKPTAK